MGTIDSRFLVNAVTVVNKSWSDLRSVFPEVPTNALISLVARGAYHAMDSGKGYSREYAMSTNGNFGLYGHCYENMPEGAGLVLGEKDLPLHDCCEAIARVITGRGDAPLAAYLCDQILLSAHATGTTVVDEDTRQSWSGPGERDDRGFEILDITFGSVEELVTLLTRHSLLEITPALAAQIAAAVEDLLDEKHNPERKWHVYLVNGGPTPELLYAKIAAMYDHPIAWAHTFVRDYVGKGHPQALRLRLLKEKAEEVADEFRAAGATVAVVDTYNNGRWKG